MNYWGKKKIGLVLSGGGARGFFHMGVIKGLQEMGIEINEIVGTSIGAVIGTIYAADPKIDFEKAANEIDFIKLIKALALGTKINSSASLENFLKSYIKKDNFEELKIPLKFNATDINKKEEIIFKKGSIFPGLLASISIPGVFSPLKYQEKYLIDGGIINNVPASLINESNKIIISDITGPIKLVNEKTQGIDVLYSSIAFMQQKLSLEKIKNIKNKKIIYLNLEDNKTFILDFRKSNYKSLIDLGYKSVMDKKREIV